MAVLPANAVPPGGARLDTAALRSLAMALLEAAGVRRDHAEVTAECLVEADCRGVHTHGVVRLPSYVAQIRAGEIDVNADPELVGSDGPCAFVLAHRCLGAVSGTLAMDEAIARARVHGIGAVTVRDGRHFGAAAFYPRRVAREGLIGVTATSTPAVMAPHGGAAAVLGNNPLSIAAPAGDGEPMFVLDIAQTMVARGRIKLAEDRGEAIPDTWAIARDGRPTNDPSEAIDGVLLPFGGHKAAGLSAAIEVLTAVASGARLCFELVNTGMTGRTDPGSAGEIGVGSLHIALDPRRLGADDGFAGRVSTLAGAIRGVPARPGHDAPLAPGDLEARAAEESAAFGALLPREVLAAVRGLAEDLDTELPSPLRPDDAGRVDA